MSRHSSTSAEPLSRAGRPGDGRKQAADLDPGLRPALLALGAAGGAGLMCAVHGTATVVTGQDKHLLNEGDVLVVPNGVPHQFVDVTAPFFYLVTKVQS